MSRLKQRADRIRQDIPIAKVLADLGYQVMADADDREQQFSCDLHGDGSDSKPSARLYPESNSFHCFACSRSRDSITTVMEKKHLSVVDACTWIEEKYGLPPLPWEDYETQERDTTQEIKETFAGGETIAGLQKRLTTLLDSLWDEREYIPLRMYLGLWETLDMVLWQIEDGKVDELKGLETLEKLRRRVILEIKKVYERTTAGQDTEQ